MFDVDLARKYNQPGPRYTSYPTAPKFESISQPEEVVNALLEHHNEAHPLSLYVHIPFCQSLCWYCGCTTVITRDKSSSKKYLDYLFKEIRLRKPLINSSKEIVQVHWGGGTPTFLEPEDIRRLGSFLRDEFPFHHNAEIGVEIDPRTVTLEHVKALREVGFNRASIGVQDVNLDVQEAIHRVQPMSQNLDAVRWLREEGFTSLNIDLIYGLPHQTVESFRHTLEESMRLNPDRLAVFSYAHVPWIKPAQKLLNESLLPNAETKLNMLSLISEFLEAHGYVHIGMDHYAKSDDELALAQKAGRLQRNFQGYSTWADSEIHAFGMSSISQSSWGYYQNEKDLPGYYSALDADTLPFIKHYQMNRDDDIRKATIMSIMCNLGFNYAELDQQYDIDSRSYFSDDVEKLRDMEEDGLVLINDEGVKVTHTGKFLIRNIAMAFDVYLPTELQPNTFSRTI